MYFIWEESRSLRALFDQGQSGRIYISTFAGLSCDLTNNVLSRLGTTPIKISNDLRTIDPGRKCPPNTLQFSSDALIWRWDWVDLI